MEEVGKEDRDIIFSGSDQNTSFHERAALNRSSHPA